MALGKFAVCIRAANGKWLRQGVYEWHTAIKELSRLERDGYYVEMYPVPYAKR